MLGVSALILGSAIGGFDVKPHIGVATANDRDSTPAAEAGPGWRR